MNYLFLIYNQNSAIAEKEARAYRKNNQADFLLCSTNKKFFLFAKNQNQPEKTLNLFTFFDSGIYVAAEGFVENNIESGDMVANKKDRSDFAKSLWRYYQKKRLDNFQEISGRYDFVIYDENKNSLLVGNSEDGSQPIYYYFNNGTMFAGSSLTPLIKNNKKINYQYLFNYFFLDGLNLGEEIEYDGIKTLPAGRLGVYSGRSFKINSPQRLPEKYNLAGKSEKELIDDFYQLIFASVKKQTEYIDAANIAFSGGLDTKTILAVLKKINFPTRTFTVRFASRLDNKNLDYKLAEQTAKKYGVDHVYIEFKPTDLIAEIGGELKDCPRLFNINHYNTYKIFNWITKQTGSAMSGDGTEEQLSLYQHHFLPFLADRMQIAGLPSTNAKAISDLIIKTYLDLLIARSWDFNQEAINPVNLARELLSPEIYKKFNQPKLFSVFNSCFKQAPDTPANLNGNFNAPSLFNKILFIDFNFWLKPRALAACDFIARKNQARICLPFFEKDFSDFCGRLPNPMKYRPTEGYYNYKYIFRQAIRPLIGEKEALTSFKSGSDIPYDEWLLDPDFEKYARHVLRPNALKKWGIINHDCVSKIINEHYHDRSLIKMTREDGSVGRLIKSWPNHTHKILKLLGLQIWLENNF